MLSHDGTVDQMKSYIFKSTHSLDLDKMDISRNYVSTRTYELLIRIWIPTEPRITFDQVTQVHIVNWKMTSWENLVTC